MPDFCLFFTFNLNGSNFDLLACKLGELYIKNSHPMITYNILGTSSSIFIEFCGIEFSANMVPWPISETLCTDAIRIECLDEVLKDYSNDKVMKLMLM